MEKVYMVVNETDRSDGVFTSPEKAAAWYYKDELLKSGNNTIEGWDKKIITRKEEVKRMCDNFADLPVIDTLKIDDENTKLVDG